MTLLQKIEIFLREANMPWTRFGRLAMNDPRFVGDLRNGRTPSLSNEKKVEHFMNKWRVDHLTSHNQAHKNGGNTSLSQHSNRQKSKAHTPQPHSKMEGAR